MTNRQPMKRTKVIERFQFNLDRSITVHRINTDLEHTTHTYNPRPGNSLLDQFRKQRRVVNMDTNGSLYVHIFRNLSR